MISIIMPIYNSQNYLEQAVNSVLAQTYLDWELMAVDDGSTDDSLEIITNFAKNEPRIKVFHKQNEGIVKTRIFATQYCSGDFICEIDSDDRVSTDYLEQMFTVQKKFQCDIVSPEMFIVSQKKSLPFYKDRTLTGKVFTGEEIFDLVLQSKIHGLFLCRSEIYKRAYNLDNLAFSAFNSDEFCSALVFYFGKSLTISGGQYLYLLRKSSITQTNNAYRFENINTSLAFIDFCKDNNLSKFSLSITQMNAIAILVHFVIFYAKYHRNFSSQEKIKIKQLLKNTKNRLKHETPNKIYGFKNRLKYIAFKFLNFLF